MTVNIKEKDFRHKMDSRFTKTFMGVIKRQFLVII